MAEHGDGARVTTRMPLFAKIVVSLFLLVVVYLLVVEVGMRFIPVPGFTKEELSPSFLEDTVSRRNMGHPYLAYCLVPGFQSIGKDGRQVSHNSLGFRGPETTWAKPKGVFRIVCLGGSSTYGHTPSSDATTWPARLQDDLNKDLATDPAWRDAGRRVEVINGGCSGYSTFESLINLEFRMVEFKPDLVLVYHSINDMRCALYPPEATIDNTHWRDIWPRYQPSPLEGVFEKSMTYLILRSRFTDYFATRRALGFVAIVGWDPTPKDLYPASLADVSPVGFRSFRRNLISIVSVARSHGAEVMFGTQGNDWHDFDGLRSKQVQFDAFQLMTRILRDVGQELDVPVAETAKALEDAAAAEYAATGETTIFSEEVHLYDPGTDLLARTFAAEILAHHLVK